VFVDDADVVQRDESNVAHINSLWNQMNDTQRTEQSLKDFLSKPIVLTSGTFKVTDTYSTLDFFTMPYAAFQSAQGDMWVQKLMGYYGIRCDIRFRLVVNANKFQQGRYCLGWVPLAGATNTTSNLKNVTFNNMHMATIVQRTTVPHVEIDLNTQTTAELLIPFMSVHNFWPLNSVLASQDRSPLGYINLYPYSPLVSPTGSTVATYTLYVSLENVTLFGASAPQGLQDREISNKSNGPISGVATAFAKGFKEFATIPLLSSYAHSISWVADRIAKTASVFGFSKPTQGDSITKMQILNNPAHCNIDGDSDSRALSYMSKPGIIPINGLSGTDLDEMDFSYVARKYANFATFAWTTASSGTLFQTTVTPIKFLTVGATGNYPPVTFLANLFNLWRGSIKFRFKIVKTQFHSGRLSFSFFPTDESSFTGGSHYVDRVIIDVRDHIEVELVIPWISRYAYLGRGVSIGDIKVEVVDGLVAPSSVSSSISILVEIAGGDDIEFAQPGNVTFVPTFFVPQSGLIDAEQKCISMTIGSSTVTSNAIAASSFTQGDKISSFRPLLRRFSKIVANNNNIANTRRPNSGTMSVYPDAMPILATGTATYFNIPDMLTTVGSCYMLWNGGVRLKNVLSLGLSATPGNITTSNCTAVTLHSSTANTSFITTSDTVLAGVLQAPEHQVLQQTFNNNAVTVEVPQYTRTLARNIADVLIYQNDVNSSFNAYQNAGATQAIVQFTLPAGLGTPAAVNANYDIHNLYRSMADDGSFSGFISVPPLAQNGGVWVSGFY